MGPRDLVRSKVQDRSRPEDLWQPLYDKANYPAAGVGTLSFFATPRGGTATLIRAGVTSSIGKTTRDTNLDTAGQIPAKGYQVLGLSQVIIPVQTNPTSANSNRIIDDLHILLFGGYITWKVGDKTILECPLHLIPAYASIEGILSTTVNNSSIAGAQNKSARGTYPMGLPVTLQPFDTFTVVYTFDGSPAITQSCDIQFLFHGRVRRPT
mgnify:CR=1 FL=1